MKLRRLQIKDAARMLEWMHDVSVVENLQTNFAKKTIDDCINFINNSQNKSNVHLAIVNDDDLYMGTVSLKHITEDSAEFAITVHRDAMGKGYSIFAMNEMLRKGFDDYNLKKIYWCVANDNLRAIRFYDKNSFPRVSSNSIEIAGDYTKEQIKSYTWYQVTRIN